MNKIEKSIVDSLNGVTSHKGNWKLFSSRCVNSNMELKSEKEKKLYNVLSEFLSDKDININVLPIAKFKTMFVDWSNEKTIESINTLVTESNIEKCLKKYFLENHLKLNRYFALAMSEKDTNNIYIVSVCRESGIYQIKEKTEKEESENENLKKPEDNETLLKIATLLNSVYALSKDLDNETKKNIITEFNNAMNFKENAIVNKKRNIA